MNNLKQYDHSDIEKKWQEAWKEKLIYQTDLNGASKPFYNLMMFPYPSAEGLHVGNMYAFTGTDIYGRFKRMQGYDVFEPIGLDGFGIHSENYAIKVGRHPKEHAKISEENFYRQLRTIGNGFAWKNHLETYDPEYYKWTQWLFIQMFKAGLAYKDKISVNWCPSCKTVLADEQVEGGKCERCGTEVIRREMGSWLFKITNYADRLLDNIDKINWPEKIKTAQRQWIGKSEGLEIDFKVDGQNKLISVWTKYWETIFGVTFLVVAPEHEIVNLLSIPVDYRNDVEKYIKQALNKSEQQRQVEAGDKTGVFTGVYVINPVNGKKIPVWIADYVLGGVGTGAVMGVPAHDSRDHDFAKKYHLDIVQVVEFSDSETNLKVKQGQLAHAGEGKLMNSQQFDGLSAWGQGKQDLAEWMGKSEFARKSTTYHLRDWIISRQRYWGAPIPMVNCPKCGWQAVPDSDLPVVLPDIEDFKPQGDGTSPLSNAPSHWKTVNCPSCGGNAERELDVLDTFLDSSWYYLAYLHMNENKWKGDANPFDQELLNKWLPVGAYIGGAEHAVLHLLYARFVAMVLKDKGFVPVEEPFPYLYSHGLIIKDGAKMSKSKGNVVIPDDYITKFGADTLRTYLMFIGPYDLGGDFRDTGMEGMNKFYQRLWKLFMHSQPKEWDENTRSNIYIKLNQTIKKVTEDISALRYNTAVSAIMELTNLLKEHTEESNKSELSKEWRDILTSYIKLIAPFAPHFAEEIWVTRLNNKLSIHQSSWPTYDEKYLQVSTINMVIQVDGKFRATVEMPTDQANDKEEVEKTAKANDKLKKWFEGKEIKESIFVPGKIINFVTN